MSEARLVDCDVHCVPATPELYPYLPEMWVELLQIGRYAEPPGNTVTYPRWNPVTRTRAEDLTLERVQSDVLDRASLAILHCYYGVESYTHPFLSTALATAVNRWLQEHWLDRDERLLGSAVVTPQYPDLAVEEIERIAADPRFVQILLPARAPAGYGERRYWPILRAAEQHGLAVAIGFGGSTGTPPTPLNWLGSYYEEYNAATLNFQSHVMSLVMSGIFVECPQLRVVCCESGWTWLPPFLWRLDQEWRAFRREVPWLKQEPPSTHIRRHFRFTTQPFDAPATPRQLQYLLEQIGSDELLLYASDYPHHYAHANDQLLAALDDEQAERVRWGNAWDCYRLGERVPAVK